MIATKKCNLCDSLEHTVCGFCTECKDHAIASNVCPTCEGQGTVEKELSGDLFGTQLCVLTCGDCEGSGVVEPLSECCGAPVWAYDDNPLEDADD